MSRGDIINFLIQKNLHIIYYSLGMVSWDNHEACILLHASVSFDFRRKCMLH